MAHLDNITTDRIQNSSERYFWTLFNSVVLLCALLGDSFILYATAQHNAFTLHRIVIVIIQHLAVCDIVLALFRVFPSVVSLLADGWVFGDGLCYLNDHVHWLCNPLVMVLTCSLTVAKYLTVKFPFRAETWSRKNAQIVCFLLWALCLFSPHHFIRALHGSIHFCHVDYSCSYKFVNHTAHVAFFTFTSHLLLVSPILISILLLSTCLLLLCEARRTALRAREQLRWQGVLAVVLTAAVFFASFAPYFVVKTTNRSVNYGISAQRTVEFLQNINIMANFFVYSLTVRSFRRFLVTRFRPGGPRGRKSVKGRSVGVISPIERRVSRIRVPSNVRSLKYAAVRFNASPGLKSRDTETTIVIPAQDFLDSSYL